MRTALTIAGSDPSGGAGIQADIKTMTAHGVYAMSAITALTVQNTTGVFEIMEVPPEFLSKQLDCIFTDIAPDAVKIGMLASSELVEAVAQSLVKYRAKNIVVDPVMLSSSGSPLLSKDAVSALQTKLMPLATVITPNIPEAEYFSRMPVKSAKDMELAARRLQTLFRCAVLVKGGHLLHAADDLLCQKDSLQWFRGERIHSSNTHGTGCTLSSAIACNLSLGYSLAASVKRAKEYLSSAIACMLDLGKGSGPLNHCCRIQEDPAN